ncbi:hypothetical protein VTO42DRAFT_4285 [Malbranchea cinnamomea]
MARMGEEETPPRSKESIQGQDEDAWNQHNEPEGPDEFGPNSDDDDELAELFGFELDPNSRASRAVATFREKVKLVKRPIALTSTVSYLSWKQSILQEARQARIDYILTINTCMTDISAKYHKFLQNQMDQAVKGDSKLLKDDLNPTL